uniref:Putative secreted protein n=1 Tax=Anopheles darlingi TaxID=43151 RepID=A0A2M4DIJ7_ANODA
MLSGLVCGVLCLLGKQRTALSMEKHSHATCSVCAGGRALLQRTNTRTEIHLWAGLVWPGPWHGGWLLSFRVLLALTASSRKDA